MKTNIILPDMFYVKVEYKDEFLKIVKANINWSGTSPSNRYPAFLKIGNGRKCDYSGELFNKNEDVYCVFVTEI